MQDFGRLAEFLYKKFFCAISSVSLAQERLFLWLYSLP